MVHEESIVEGRRRKMRRLLATYATKHTSFPIFPSSQSPNTLPFAQIPIPAITHISSPFNKSDLYTYTVNLGSSNDLGLTLIDDTTFGVPTILSMHPNSPFRSKCLHKLRRQAWIISIHFCEPCTVNEFLEYIKYLRKENIRSFQLTLTPRMDTNSTRYAEYPAYFDGCRPLLNATTFSPQAHFVVQLPEKPQTPSFITELKNNPHKEFWYNAIMERHEKNHAVGLLSPPISRASLPSTTVVISPISVFKIKPTDMHNYYDFYYRLCVHGGKLEQQFAKHFLPQSSQKHAGVSSNESVRITCALAAGLRLTLCTMDVSNAFQNTPRYLTGDTQPVFINSPPLYLQWFRRRFPHVKIHGPPPYVHEIFMNMQGMVTASRDFNKLLSSLMKQDDIHATSVDNGFYILIHKKTQILFLNLATDDLLVATNSASLKQKLFNKLTEAFKVTIQEGTLLHFLNYRIIQSPAGVSLDQTTHILEKVDKYTSPGSKKVHTPLRTDRQFDDDIYLSLPASKEELQHLAQEYGGSFLQLFGEINHIASASRLDLANAVNRLGVFQSSPNRLGFQCLRRLFQFLRTYPNIPLMYPSISLNTITSFTTINTSPKASTRLSIPHCLCGFVDTAPGSRFDRHQIDGFIELIGTVSVGWGVSKNVSCATSMTDAEIRAYFREAKRIKKIRLLLQQLGHHLHRPSTIHTSMSIHSSQPTCIFEDNKGARDCISAGRITSNLKHVDVPLTYLHEQHENGSLACKPCPSNLMQADMLTKQLTGPKHHEQTQWNFGYRYYPPTNSEHYKLLSATIPLYSGLQK